ncbi:MAG: hypothetical protein E7173_01115 [Firmicutes bacterium]|nr:hypothetical protein [Bacillota bacterium]
MEKETVKVKGGKVTKFASDEKLAKLKAGWQKHKARIIAIGLTIIVLIGSVILFFVNKSKNNNKTNTIGTSQHNPDTGNKKEKYSRELLADRINSFGETAKTNGLELTPEEVRTLATLINIDQIVSEDSELAKELYDGKNAQDILSNAGHVIGKLMTSSLSNNFKTPMNLSLLVVGNDYDKSVLTKLESYRDELTALRAEEPGEHRVEFGTKEEKERFDQIISDVLMFYGMTADGLSINGENGVIQSMGDGARFASVLVMNEILLGNRNLLTTEQIQAFEALMSNEPATANLHRIIEGCQTTEVEPDKVKTK